jgi:hypothetical protein
MGLATLTITKLAEKQRTVVSAIGEAVSVPDLYLCN